MSDSFRLTFEMTLLSLYTLDTLVHPYVETFAYWFVLKELSAVNRIVFEKPDSKTILMEMFIPRSY